MAVAAAFVAVTVMFSGCAHVSPLSQAEAEATWEAEWHGVGYDEARFAPLWSAGAPLATPSLNRTHGTDGTHGGANL